MHPILSQLRSLLWYLAAWVIGGLVMAWVLVVSHATPWPAALTFTIPVTVAYGFISLSAYYVCRSYPLANRNLQNMIFIFGSASLLSGAAWIVLCLLLNSLSLYVESDWLGIGMTPQLTTSLFCLASLIYIVSLLAHDLLIAQENIRDAELKKTAAQLFARDAELQVLRSQINPHFLFNSLNSISALTAIDAVAARAMVIELSDFFRKSVALTAHSLIPLGDELKLCEHYLAIEKNRFGDRLQTQMTIEPDSLRAQVPPMFLQPLVENAIKHGISNLDEGGAVTLMTSLHESWLYIAISNPMDSHAPSASGTATGLRNLKARFENLYGERARVSWQESHRVFRVEIIIPFECA
ncbi:MAG: sensor histidine kinase [Gammaproteobacteria bacterium]|nr:MAG: sensor histidine kinase [Gammaproteobacteria bacterium]